MADARPYPEGAYDGGLGPDRESPPSTPRWVKAFGIGALVLLLLFAGLHLTGYAPTHMLGWLDRCSPRLLALGVAAVTSSETQTVRATWIAMELTGWWVIVPLAVTALLIGLIMSLGTYWGLFRHYWVRFSLALTTLSTSRPRAGSTSAQ